MLRLRAAARLDPARDRPRGVGAPLAPRARDRAACRGRPACVHREQVVAGGDAGPAVVDDSRAARGRRGARRTRRARRGGGLERPSASRLSRYGRLTRAGNVAGDRIERLDVAAIALARARVDQQRATRAARFAAIARRVDGRGATRAARTWPRETSGASVVTGRPSRAHAAKPPSSTAAASCPSQRSIHHRRAAYMPPPWSYATTCFVASMPRRPNDARAGFRRRAADGGHCGRSSAPTGRGRGARTGARECALRGTALSPQASGCARSCRTSTITSDGSREAARPSSAVLMSVVNIGRPVGQRHRSFSAARDAARARAGGTRGSAACRPPSATGTALLRCGPAGRARCARRPSARRSRRPRAPSRGTPPARLRRTRARTARSPRDSRTRRRWSSGSTPRGISVLTTSTCGYHSSMMFG